MKARQENTPKRRRVVARINQELEAAKASGIEGLGYAQIAVIGETRWTCECLLAGASFSRR